MCPPEAPAHVLVVDDEPLVLKTIHRLLRTQFRVTTACGAGDALEHIARGEAFDAVLCDVMMPEMTGIELLARLGQVAPELARRTVFMTGGLLTSAQLAEFDAIPNAKIGKPFDIVELREALRKAVEDGGPT